MKKKIKLNNYLLMFISLIMSALAFNLFIKELNIATGGVNGIAIIINGLFNIDFSLIIFIELVILLILSFIFLGVKKTTGSIISVFLYPFLVKITSGFSTYITINRADFCIYAIFIGFITGIANGLMYKSGFSNGGLPIINQILSKYKNISIKVSNFLINGIIVLIGGIYLGITKMLYAILILYINSYVIERILNNKGI